MDLLMASLCWWVMGGGTANGSAERKRTKQKKQINGIQSNKEEQVAQSIFQQLTFFCRSGREAEEKLI
eukprot:UN22081